MFTARFAKCRGSSPQSVVGLQLGLPNAGAAPLGTLDVYSYICKYRGSSPWSLLVLRLQLCLQNAGAAPL